MAEQQEIPQAILPLPLILAGPSAVGKGTLGSLLIERNPECFQWCCSHTTRAPRPLEVHGVHYWFITREEFEALWSAGNLIERNEYNGNLYGTSYAAMKLIQANNKICILDIDINGVSSFKKSQVPARFLFIVPPEPRLETLHKRLQNRGTEDPIAVANRINRAQSELEFLQNNIEIFDKILVNDNLEIALKEIQSFVGLH